MISSINDIKKFLNDKSFKKIFILCGKNSFLASGAKKFIDENLPYKEIKYFYKKSNIPILDELIEIILNNCKIPQKGEGDLDQLGGGYNPKKFKVYYEKYMKYKLK